MGMIRFLSNKNLTTCLTSTLARDFHSLFLKLFLHLSVTNIYKTQYSYHFRKYSSNSPRYSKFSITRRFRRKRKAWQSVVAENTELNLVLSSHRYEDNAKFNVAFSATTLSHASRFRQKRGVIENIEYLCEF